MPYQIRTEHDLASLCLALLSKLNPILSSSESKLISRLNANQSRVSSTLVAIVKELIENDEDPLGDAFMRLRSLQVHRSTGAVYTPISVVRSMMQWLKKQGSPERIVDPGAGSGRFILEAGRKFPNAQLVAVEKDPLAALMLRANLHVKGWLNRSVVRIGDYRRISLPVCDGVTAFIGNPPYVRHHEISPLWKVWYAKAFADFGIRASALAGLHLHFFLKTYLLARADDIGAFITSAQWMDTNYGSALRELLLDGLGATSLHVLEPQLEVFPDTATTVAITCFQVGKKSDSMRVQTMDHLNGLNELGEGTDVPHEQFRATSRWSIIVRPSMPDSVGTFELGDFFHVHRGQVTGANRIWIAGEEAQALPERILYPTVTRARELIDAGFQLTSAAGLRRIVDLPVDLDVFNDDERRKIDRFLAWAKICGADRGYVARHRRVWWSVGLREPAPILCTYMARRPPQFSLNTCRAYHINIAHGLYPKVPLEENVLGKLVLWLNQNIDTRSGRTYAGGLTKFEPREIERLRIPDLEFLNDDMSTATVDSR